MVAINSSTLSKRDTYQCNYYGNCYYTAWGGWGRWVLLAGIVILFLVFFCSCARITGMRRRRRGLQPYAGTAWVLPKYEAGPNAQYPPGPPPYNPPVNNNNDTPLQPQQSGNYYAPQNNYTEQQQQPFHDVQPQHSQYAPPMGAPPQESGFVAGSSNPYYPPPQSPPQSHLKH